VSVIGGVERSGKQGGTDRASARWRRERENGIGKE